MLVDRLHLISASDMLPDGVRFLLQPAGKQFRRFRHTVHTHLQPKAAQMYQEIQEEAAREVILDILSDPKGHMTHAQWYVDVRSLGLLVPVGLTAYMCFPTCF